MVVAKLVFVNTNVPVDRALAGEISPLAQTTRLKRPLRRVRACSRCF